MENTTYSSAFLNAIIDRIDVGICIVNRDMKINLWNSFMESYSNIPSAEAIGMSVFEVAPELPTKWLKKKINSVFLLKNFAFTSWEQRPYLFKFKNNRPFTAGVDYMRQNCTFMPLVDENGSFEHVCITIYDVTDTSIYHKLHNDAMESLMELSVKDGLTGIYNRRYFEEQFTNELLKIKRYGGTMSLVMFDLDLFKKVNDIHGHMAGDKVLIEISKMTSAHLRKTDFFGRYGGEEFMIALPHTSGDGAYTMAERLRCIIASQSIKVQDTSIPVTISIGITSADMDTPDIKTLFKEADTALYKSKEGGRNMTTVYKP